MLPRANWARNQSMTAANCARPNAKPPPVMPAAMVTTSRCKPQAVCQRCADARLRRLDGRHPPDSFSLGESSQKH
jgi:hypothetical protein